MRKATTQGIVSTSDLVATALEMWCITSITPFVAKLSLLVVMVAAVVVMVAAVVVEEVAL